jgi:hypothetical protein
MVWTIGLVVLLLVHVMGVAAGVLLVNGERHKAIGLGVAAMLVGALGIHFALVASEIRATQNRIENDDLR